VAHRRRTYLLFLGSLILIAAQAFGMGATATAAGSPSRVVQHAQLNSTFTPSAQGAGTATGGATDEIPPHEPNSKTIRHGSASGVPVTAGNAVVGGQLSGFGGFNALSHLDQRAAGTGQYANTQFSLEPPDQGLCVGNGDVVEAVNNALQVFTTSGSALTVPIALSQFFGTKPEINRSVSPVVSGDFISDPRCYFDPGTGRWFLTELEMALDPATGDFAAPSHQFIAVSQSADPTGTWAIYSLNTTDDGMNGTPSDPGCPCFGDQPLIGADANGFYITTNEYGITSSAYNGGQVYAFSKAGLESGANTNAVRIDAGAMLTAGGLPAFSIQPATSPNQGYEAANNGTAYFMSAMDLGAGPTLGTRASSLAVWALTNTKALDSTNMNQVALSYVVIASEPYAQPPNAQQKPGPTPLASGQLVSGLHDHLELLAANDDRLNQVVYAGGHLWAALNTGINLPNGPTNAGIAYFVVTPSDTSGQLSATIAEQGYVGVTKEDVLFPSIGVTDAGSAVMAFTLVGPDYYPSAAYASLDLTSGVGSIHIAGAGALPDDGFSGYRQEGGAGVGRWGDYSAAVADTSGNVWMAAEYIPNAPRTVLANWGTFISHVTP